MDGLYTFEAKMFWQDDATGHYQYCYGHVRFSRVAGVLLLLAGGGTTTGQFAINDFTSNMGATEPAIGIADMGAGVVQLNFDFNIIYGNCNVRIVTGYRLVDKAAY